jgi:hypothetical protein
MTSTFSDAILKNMQSELTSWAREIADEMRLLLAKRVAEEAENNWGFRSAFVKRSKRFNHQQELAAKLRTLKICSTYDHETTWKQLRKLGSTTLFANDPEYIRWRIRTESCTLLYLGILGCGKSVTLANIIGDLHLRVRNENASLVYFFVRHDLATSLKARTVIGSIAKQILSSAEDLANTVEASQITMDPDDMLTLICRAIPKNRKIYVVLDGLDHCGHLAKEEVVGFLRNLQDEFCVLVCISFRHEPNAVPDAKLRELRLTAAVSVPDNRADVEIFIEAELAHRLDNRSLTVGDPKLVLEIQDALLAGSKGMFLWVSLQIESICASQTDAEIREVLAHLPDDLSEIYARIVRKQQGPAIKYQDRIFQLMIAAQRPLSAEEMREALSVTPGDTTWSAAKLIHDVFSALAMCGCLVIVDEEELTVRFVHPTVEQYILERHPTQLGEGATIQSCHMVMADTIVTYLSYGVFGTDVSTFRIPRIEVGSAPAQIMGSTMMSTRAGVQSLALRLLRSRKRPDFDMGKIIAEEVNAHQQAEGHQFHFHSYAEHYCVEHVTKARPLGITHLKRLYPHVLNTLCSAEPAPDNMNPGRASSHSLSLEAAAQNNDLGLMELILPIYSSFPQFRTNIEWELGRAICEGSEDKTKLLVKNITFEHVWATNPGPLLDKHMCVFAYRGDAENFPREGHYLREIRHICKSGRSILACAIWGGNIPMAKAILNHEAIDVNRGSPGFSPIWDAVRTGSVEAVGLLFSSRLLKLRYGEGTALLALAEEKGHSEITEWFQEAANRSLNNLLFAQDIEDWTFQNSDYV